MGGDGSGRRPDVIKMMMNQENKGKEFIRFDEPGIPVEIPNYSGVKKAALLTSPAAVSGSHGVDGAVQFAKDGGFFSDDANLHWDDSNNRLGIGTTSPGAPLDVYGTAFLGGAGADSVAFVRSAASGNLAASQAGGQMEFGSRITATPGTTYYGAQIKGSAAETWNVGVAQGMDLIFSTVAVGSATLTNRMTIQDDGNVGIGTTSPSYLLHVVGDTGLSVDGTGRTDGVTINHTGSGNYQVNHEGTGQLTIKSTGGGVILQAGTSSDNLTFNTGDTTGARITIKGGAGADLGFVGIGTASPTTLLNLSGATTQLRIANPNARYLDISEIAGTGAIFDTNDTYIFQTDSTTRMVLTDDAVELKEATDNTPTLSLSGGMFISGGALWYKGFAGTYTLLGAS